MYFVLILATAFLLPGCDTKPEPGPPTTAEVAPRDPFDLLTEYQESYPKYILHGDSAAGLCVEILGALERVSGLRIGARINQFTPFFRLQKHLEAGRIDLFVGFRQTKARSRRYRFLEPPVYRVATVVAALAEEERQIDRLDDLAGERVMIPHGSATAQLVRSQHPLIQIDEGGDIFACLEKLVRGRGRFVVYHDLGTLAAIRAMGLQERVKILPGTFGTYDHYVAVSLHAEAAKVARVEAALAQLQQTRELDRIARRYRGL